MLRQSSRKKDVKDICYSRLHLFLFVGFLVDGPKKKTTKIQLNISKIRVSIRVRGLLFFPFLSLPFPSFPFLSLAPTPSAHHRSNQLAPHAVNQLNENPSIEDAFGKATI